MKKLNKKSLVFGALLGLTLVAYAGVPCYYIDDKGVGHKYQCLSGQNCNQSWSCKANNGKGGCIAWDGDCCNPSPGPAMASAASAAPADSEGCSD